MRSGRARVRREERRRREENDYQVPYYRAREGWKEEGEKWMKLLTETKRSDPAHCILLLESYQVKKHQAKIKSLLERIFRRQMNPLFLLEPA